MRTCMPCLCLARAALTLYASLVWKSYLWVAVSSGIQVVGGVRVRVCAWVSCVCAGECVCVCVGAMCEGEGMCAWVSCVRV